MRKLLRMAWLVPLVVAMAWVALAQAAPGLQAPPASIAAGGRLYDKWWNAAPGAAEPKEDQALWATQTTNTRKAGETWRCKECHGWDYGGKDGAYGSGSHKTGFIGVSVASKKSQAELVAILKGSSNPKHDFSQVLDAASINNLASFLKEGLVDMSQYIDSATKKPKRANAAHGKVLYEGTCAACHGSDGMKLNFGNDAAPEFVGTIAVDNPWEFLHKVRAGQPGAVMPSAIESGWTVEDSVDVLAHAQTLPREKPKLLVANVSKGGRLYDKWWNEAPGATEPKQDQALWATQTSNTRKGSETWRCKECHGWDYKGKDGAYGSGSHKTGFVGVADAAGKKSQAELVAALKGSGNPNHDFSKVVDADSINNLAAFLKDGLVDDAQFIDYTSKKPKNANAGRGKDLYEGGCAACHGNDGTKLNFGNEAAPEFVGTIAVDNPWEFLHKVRAGQPNAAMPSGLERGWPTQDAVDVLAHAQSLPAQRPAALPRTGGPVDSMLLVAFAAVSLMGVGLLARRWSTR